MLDGDDSRASHAGAGRCARSCWHTPRVRAIPPLPRKRTKQSPFAIDDRFWLDSIIVACDYRVAETVRRRLLCRTWWERRRRALRRSQNVGGRKIDSVRHGRRARVRAGCRRALSAIPEAGQFVSSARFVMPAVVLPNRHCIAATKSSTKSPSYAAAVTIAAAAVATAGNNIAATTTTTTTTTLYWLPIVDSPACCYCCYCGGRLFVGTTSGNKASGFGSGTGIGCFDACSPPLPSRTFGRLCRCGDGTAAVVLLVPYVLGPPCFRPSFVFPTAFVAAAANNFRHHHRWIQQHHRRRHLYNTAVAGYDMETR